MEDYPELEHTALVNLMPWTWVVEYDPRYDHRPPPLPGKPPLSMPKCPSQASKLTSFVVINLIIFCTSAIFGRRTVIHTLSGGRLGKPEGSGTWVLTSLFFLGISIAANFLNAAIIRSAPGFGGASTVGLALLWCSRPRLAWSAALMVYVGKERGDYFTSGASALLSEIVMQLMGAVYLGRTVNFAAVNDLYLASHADSVVKGWNDAVLMYAGALVWISAVHHLKRLRPTAALGSTGQQQGQGAPPLVPPRRRIGPVQYQWERALNAMGLNAESLKRMRTFVFLMILPFIGQWMFWAGFIRLAGDR
jgi:hypothetical protein